MEHTIKRDRHNSKQWKFYIVRLTLQAWAFIITLFTGRKITHGFYYSEMQKEISEDENFFLTDTIASPNRKVTFRGKEYTEMRELINGWCNWKDSKLIGLGSMEDVKFIPIKAES